MSIPAQQYVKYGLHTLEVGEPYVAWGPDGKCWAGEVKARATAGETWVFVRQIDDSFIFIRPINMPLHTAYARFAVKRGEVPILQYSPTSWVLAAPYLLPHWAIAPDELERQTDAVYRFARCITCSKFRIDVGLSASLRIEGDSIYYLPALAGKMVAQFLTCSGGACFEAH